MLLMLVASLLVVPHLVPDEVPLQGADDGDASAYGRLVPELDGALALAPRRVHLNHGVLNLRRAKRAVLEVEIAKLVVSLLVA